MGVIKLNFDGSAMGNPGPSRSGGVLRDNMGVHILSFSVPSGFRLVNEAELFALWTGL